MAIPFYEVAAVTTGAMLLGAGVLHLVRRLGAVGRRVSDALCRAPALDLVITYFTVAPLIVGPIVGGWRGLAGGIVGQVAGLLAWTALHELTHPRQRRGPRIIKVSNRLIGPLRNQVATWLTAVVTPMFWVVRVSEITLWPPIRWLTGFPSYRSADWVNVSRHKFSGLVGHDLIWCLYCAWMTGVWSLGSEMLRNVESFWCPIRFASDRKCANCAVDFPDVRHDWVPADGNMADVAETLERMYSEGEYRSWYGHLQRLTVKGRPVEIAPAVAEEQTAEPVEK
jgi:hypothetical protein